MIQQVPGQCTDMCLPSTGITSDHHCLQSLGCTDHCILCVKLRLLQYLHHVLFRYKSTMPGQSASYLWPRNHHHVLTRLRGWKKKSMLLPLGDMIICTRKNQLCSWAGCYIHTILAVVTAGVNFIIVQMMSPASAAGRTEVCTSRMSPNKVLSF